MGYVLPEGADAMLDLIGVGWPNVDEDAYRDMAKELRDFADDVDEDAAAAHRGVQRLLSSGDSEALDALSLYWDKVKGKHLKDLADAARVFAGALDAAATVIAGRKAVAVGELAALAASVGIGLAAAPFTAGLSTLLSAGAIQACRIAVKRALKEAADLAVEEIVAAMSEPAVAALEGMAAELVVQLAANGLGVQDGVDMDKVGDAGKEGLKEGLHLASADGIPHLGGLLGKLDIDEGEHDRAALNLNGVSTSMKGRTSGKLGTARGHQSRTRGKDDIANLVNEVADRGMAALEKATKQLGDHLGGALPKGVRNIAGTHQANDRHTKEKFDGIKVPDATDGKGDKPGGGGPGGPPNGGGGDGGNGNRPERRPMNPQPDWHGRSAGKMRHHRGEALHVDHLSPAERTQVLEEESLNLANAARDEPVREKGDYPVGKDRLTKGCAGSLLHDGVITSHTSTTQKHGMKFPETHPAVADALKQAEAEITAKGLKNGAGHGKCAEVSLISDRLHQLDPGGTKIRTMEDAREALSGAMVHTRQIGDSRTSEGRLLHGDYKPPCTSCEHMLPLLGVTAHR
ncbi:MAG TPA: YwqJ-related putative deaminase [Streptomyces sp.]|uniref:YwqJ-related putative deaminase n=1 Tax=Streptomyces sp. TaxID=1931 RepID=UPI002D3673C7|nr:YwqJ-related putative deaminase [Streptomyces sp.]HZG01951.1 YwqJ-related putative deaminase [Streptomyces sp.]